MRGLASDGRRGMPASVAEVPESELFYRLPPSAGIEGAQLFAALAPSLAAPRPDVAAEHAALLRVLGQCSQGSTPLASDDDLLFWPPLCLRPGDHRARSQLFRMFTFYRVQSIIITGAPSLAAPRRLSARWRGVGTAVMATIALRKAAQGGSGQGGGGEGGSGWGGGEQGGGGQGSSAGQAGESHRPTEHAGQAPPSGRTVFTMLETTAYLALSAFCQRLANASDPAVRATIRLEKLMDLPNTLADPALYSDGRVVFEHVSSMLDDVIRHVQPVATDEAGFRILCEASQLAWIRIDYVRELAARDGPCPRRQDLDEARMIIGRVPKGRKFVVSHAWDAAHHFNPSNHKLKRLVLQLDRLHASDVAEDTVFIECATCCTHPLSPHPAACTPHPARFH